MTARMHLALDGAFQREHEPVVDWVDEAEATIAASDASLLEAPGVTDLVKWLRESEARLPVIRTHGDFHLGRTARTDQGWVVSDCAPGRRRGPGVHRAPAYPAGRRGRPAVVDAPRQHGGRRRARPHRDGSGWLRSATPGRCGTAAPSWPATWARRASVGWSGPTGTWCGGWCRSWSWPARCGTIAA